jgi:hypothetical protein
VRGCAPDNTVEPFAMPDSTSEGGSVSTAKPANEPRNSGLPGPASTTSLGASGCLNPQQTRTVHRRKRLRGAAGEAWSRPALEMGWDVCGDGRTPARHHKPPSPAQPLTHRGSASCSRSVGCAPTSSGACAGTTYDNQYVPGTGEGCHVGATSRPCTTADTAVRLVS